MNYQNKDEVFEKLKQIINDVASDDTEITKETNLYDDLGLDSLDKVELIMECENKFLINIPDENIERVKTVQELLDVVYDRL